MSFESQVAELIFNTDGASTAFPLSNGGGALFFMDGADLKAVYTTAGGVASTLAYTTGFTVSGDGRTGSGVLHTVGPALATGGTLRIWCETVIQQPEQYAENDGFPSATHETAQDRGRMIDRDVNRRLLRTLRLPDIEPFVDMTLPALAVRKGGLMGFDLVTGAPSIAVVPTAATLQVIANAAAASAAAAAASAASVSTNYRNVANFFDLVMELNPSGGAALIAQIQANTAGYLDTPTNYFAQVIARGGTWFFPRGSYHLANKLHIGQGLKFWGAGDIYSDTPGLTGSTIYLGGNAGEWGIEQLNPVSGGQYVGFCAKDMYFNVTQNGIRLNSATGGFSDDSSTQGYMMRPRFERCFFGMDGTPGLGKALQFSKAFDIVVRDCNFADFSTSIDFQGSDIKVVEGCRFDSDTGYSINSDSQGTFGSSLKITGNDFNDPYGYVKSTDLDILIDFNHMEFDRDKTRTTASIQISGNAFHTKIHNNRVQNGALVTNWLSITNDVNRFLVSVFDNTTSAPTQMGAISYPAQSYFSNGGTRAMIAHGRNSAGDNSFPMNWVDGLQYLPAGYAAIVTPSTAGVDGGASNLNPLCEFGAFTIHPNASSTIYMQISDWGNYGLPANVLKGTLTISLVTAGGAAGQQGKWSLHDNSGTPLASGTITHTVANQMTNTVICTSQAFATNCWLRLWNEDTGHGERFYVYSAAFKIG